MSEPEELVIEAGRAERQYWRDLWRYRELFYFLAWRDILVRYKQTAVGIAWALLRPLLTTLIFTLVFKGIAKVPDDGVPYPLTTFVALLAWNFFSISLQESGNSMVANSNLISKIYFPRLVVPAATVVTTFVDFLISGVLLIGLLIYYRFIPSIQIVFLPFFVALAFGAAIGCGLWLSALMVRFRDVRFIVPFIVQFGLYLSPIGFKTSALPAKLEQWRVLYSLNPIVGVIDGFRWSILGGPNAIDPGSLAVSIAATIILLVSGVSYFRKTERSFADVI
jgi:lipopolysaccharide transport system permease protein